MIVVREAERACLTASSVSCEVLELGPRLVWCGGFIKYVLYVIYTNMEIYTNSTAAVHYHIIHTTNSRMADCFSISECSRRTVPPLSALRPCCMHTCSQLSYDLRGQKQSCHNSVFSANTICISQQLRALSYLVYPFL